ncbi:MAG: S-layer homology domain-containing protein [Oscillospiraceae bacterium]|nr:S-layer homology domain-containing protein [Oscillospiraceae bacterium]
MKLTGLSVNLSDSETTELLAAYSDSTSVSSYARESAAQCLKAGVVTGSSTTTLSPKAYVTRAEVAVMVQRMLEKSGLI